MKLKEAVRILVEEEFLEDWIYDIRDRAREEERNEQWGNFFEDNPEASSWDHPRVERFSEVCETLKEYLKGKN